MIVFFLARPAPVVHLSALTPFGFAELALIIIAVLAAVAPGDGRNTMAALTIAVRRGCSSEHRADSLGSFQRPAAVTLNVQQLMRLARF